MSKAEKVAELISAHVRSNGGYFSEPLFQELAQKNGFVAEPTVYQFVSVVRKDPAFKSGCSLSPDEVLWLFRMYSNMKGRVPNWVRPISYPVTERSAKDIWYHHRGLDPRVERAKTAEHARSVCAENRTQKGSKKKAAASSTATPFSRPSGDSEDLLRRLSEILNSHDAMAQELKETRKFISGLLPLMENLEAAFEMGREELASLRARATCFLSDENETVEEPQSDTTSENSTEVPAGPIFETASSPDSDAFERVCGAAREASRPVPEGTSPLR